MVAGVGASEAFTAQFLDDPENWSIIEQAQIFCSEVKSNFNKIDFEYIYIYTFEKGFLSCVMS